MKQLSKYVIQTTSLKEMEILHLILESYGIEHYNRCSLKNLMKEDIYGVNHLISFNKEKDIYTYKYISEYEKGSRIILTVDQFMTEADKFDIKIC